MSSSLRKTVKYREDDINNSDYMIHVLSQEYEVIKVREEDKQQQIMRNRKLVEQMVNANSKNFSVNLPQLTKQEEMLFERLEVMRMNKQPIFRVVQSSERRVMPYQGEQIPRSRVVVEKLCVCCGNIVKKHCCAHSLCQKPCKIEQKRLKMRGHRIEEKEKSRSVNQNDPQPDVET